MTHPISRFAALLAGSIGAVGGCRSTPQGDRTLVLFPGPPGEPRIQFLTWASGAQQVEAGRTAFADFVLGEEPALARVIQKPYGIAARDGVVYVCDTKGLSIGRLDFRAGAFSTLGVSGPGRLRKPLNIAIDPLGYKFVVDSDRKQVVVFGPGDEYVTAFDLPQPCHPVDLAIYQDELLVLDNDETCQILVLDRKTGDVIRTVGGPGGEPGQFKIPNSLAVGPDGSIYVSDTHNWRIQKLTRDGRPIWAKGGPGYRLGQFGRPRGIRVGPDGIVYVVDGATEIVQMFDQDGNVLMRFGGPGSAPGALGLPSTLAIDASSIPYFQKYVHEAFEVDYLLFVASQFGERLVNVYAFGSFPPGYKLPSAEIRSLDASPIQEGIGPVSGDEPQAGPTPEQTPPDEESPKP
jgi:streptogramin lyase